MLLTGSVVPHMAKHLAGALEADDALTGAVRDATARQKRDEARLDRTLWEFQDAISGRSADSGSRANELTAPLSGPTSRCRQSVRCPRRFSLPPY